MRSIRAILAVFVVLASVTACDGDNVDGLLVVGSHAGDLAGTWTGTEELSTAGEFGSGSGDGFAGAFSFPVSLTLRIDRTFTLRSFNFPVDGNGEADRLCRGIYRVRGNTLEFFPDDACRALPLSRFTIGRGLVDALTLVAQTPTDMVGATTGGASIRVRIRVERG